jgi:hypothetical protein
MLTPFPQYVSCRSERDGPSGSFGRWELLERCPPQCVRANIQVALAAMRSDSDVVAVSIADRMSFSAGTGSSVEKNAKLRSHNHFVPAQASNQGLPFDGS